MNRYYIKSKILNFSFCSNRSFKTYFKVDYNPKNKNIFRILNKFYKKNPTFKRIKKIIIVNICFYLGCLIIPGNYFYIQDKIKTLTID